MTFVTLAMLVVGGARGLSGAVVGVVVVRFVTELLRRAEDGVHLNGVGLALPAGSQAVALAIVLLVILIFRPDGLLGDYELTWRYAPWATWRRARKAFMRPGTAATSITEAKR